jgi:hypothetical protein
MPDTINRFYLRLIVIFFVHLCLGHSISLPCRSFEKYLCVTCAFQLILDLYRG